MSRLRISEKKKEFIAEDAEGAEKRGERSNWCSWISLEVRDAAQKREAVFIFLHVVNERQTASQASNLDTG